MYIDFKLKLWRPYSRECIMLCPNILGTYKGWHCQCWSRSVLQSASLGHVMGVTALHYKD